MFSELKQQSISQYTDSVQRKSGQSNAQVLEDNRDLNSIQRKPNRTGLPDNLKSGMESLSGKSLDHVKVHYNSSKPAAVQAHAYAQGSDIHLASGQEKHLPHELGHVVQQMEGRVKPTTSVGGMAVNDNPSLENEATEMGNRAIKNIS
ncbi:eCIS core domain-containing protein [Vibrio sp. FJH11]